MEDELISKKELLEITGISYGQLYRWKRKNLIPEEWFIKKSSFTGQETFFPKEKVLGRIDKIKDLKEDISLDELAAKLSPGASDVILSYDRLIKENIVTKAALDLYIDSKGNTDAFSFQSILTIKVIEQFLLSGEASLDEVKTVMETLEENNKDISEKKYQVILIRKLGVAICVLIEAGQKLIIGSKAKVVYSVVISDCAEKLKMKLTI
jgi:DNA-binding transcriptional MerR regulator